MPVARSTRAIPPRPNALASVAAHSRRDRSVNTDFNPAYFLRKILRVTNLKIQHVVVCHQVSYFFTSP
jgi:hypothetical protein